MRVFIDGLLVNDVLITVDLNQNLEFLGQIVVDSGTVKLFDDGGDYENKTIMIYDNSNNRDFIGYTLTPKKNDSTGVLTIPFKDRFEKIKNTRCTKKTWKDILLHTIISDVIGMTTETAYSIETTTQTVAWFSVDETQTVQEVLRALVQSVGGLLYYIDGGLVFKAGFESAFSTTTAEDYTKSQIAEPKTSQDTTLYDSAEVNFYSKNFKTISEKIFQGVNQENQLLIPADGVGVSNDYYLDANSKIYELGDWTDVIFEAETELTLDQTTYEANFQTGTQPVSDSKIKIKITNSDTTSHSVSNFVIKGKKIVETKEKAKYKTSSNTLSVSSDVVSDDTWAGKLAQWLYENATKEYIALTIQDFVFDIELNQKFSYDGTRYVCCSKNTSASETKEIMTIKGYKDRTSAFSYNSSQVSFESALNTVDRLYGDGEEPEPPTSLVLTTSTVDYVSTITASWDASTSTDVLKYAVEWKKQGDVWGSANKAETNGYSYRIDVEELTTYDVRVKAVDVEEMSSTYATAQKKSIVITGDGTALPSYIWDISEIEYQTIDNKRYVYLKWEPLTTAAVDLKSFKIVYTDLDADYDNYLEDFVLGLGTIPDIQQTEEINNETFEVLIPIPNEHEYSFKLFVEDYDGNRDVYIDMSTPQTGLPSRVSDFYGGYFKFDFSSSPMVPLYSGAPTFATDAGTWSDFAKFYITAPSTAENVWDLEVCFNVAGSDWTVTKTYKGSENLGWVPSRVYSFTFQFENLHDALYYQCKCRFVHSVTGQVGSWTDSLMAKISAYSSSTLPATSTSLTAVGDTNAQSERFVVLECEDLENAVQYEWQVCSATSGGTIYRTGITTQTEYVVNVDANRPYARVRGINKTEEEGSWAAAAITW